MKIIKEIVKGKNSEEKIDIMSNQLLVKLKIHNTEGTFDISKLLYQVPASIVKKGPTSYTKEDVEILQKMQKIKKTTKTIAKSIVPKETLEAIRTEQYVVKKAYDEMILLSALPIMNLEDYEKLKNLIAESEKNISEIKKGIAEIWDECVEKFKTDLENAYPDAPIENLNRIVHKANMKKASILNSHGFGLSVTVLPSSNGLNDELKKVIANQTTDNMFMIFEDAIKEAFDNVSNVYLIAERQLKSNKDTYIIHGKTRKQIPSYGKKFKKKMTIIGASNFENVKAVQKIMDMIATEEKYIFDDVATAQKCGELSYLLIQIANENDIKLSIPDELDIDYLDMEFGALAI